MHAGITGLADSLAVMTHLEEVVLLGYRISGWPVQVLSAALAQLHDLVRLELELASVNTCWSTSSMHASARYEQIYLLATDASTFLLFSSSPESPSHEI